MNNLFQLIKSRWVLTAAHCVTNTHTIEVFLGAINQLQDGSSGSFIKAINVTQLSSIVRHQGYVESVFRNDIALIYLPEDAPIVAQRTAFVPLPVGLDATRNLENLQGTVSGFGRFSDASDFVSLELNYVILPILANTVCATTYGTASVTASSVCLSSVNRRSVCGG